MRTRARFVALVFVASALSGTLAFAQSRSGKHGKSAKPAPAKTSAPAAKPDAAPRAPVANDAGVDAAVDTADSQTSEDLSPPEAEAFDGGVRPSPLNPTAEEMPGRAADAGPPVDVDRILADVAALRARVAAVSDTLYRSRLALSVVNDASHGRLTSLVVSIDDGVVFVAPKTFSASEAVAVYEHAVAPGRHAVTIEAERSDERNDAFRTTQRNRFVVDVPRDHRVDVQVKLVDDSSMGKDFPGDLDGEYDLRLRVRAIAKPASK